MTHGHAWILEEPGKPLVRKERTWEGPAEGLALLEVLGCGVCHTDLGFADGHVATKKGKPIVLGHEIVGRVLAVGGDGDKARTLVGRRVLAPAVSPCGACAACKRGRPTACPTGRMPGNDADGGFATHCYLPYRDVVVLDAASGADGPIGAAKLEAWEIAPVADAATTAYQAMVRADLADGDVAIFVGAGGVGGFGAQLAKAEGARVVALDVDDARLAPYKPMIDLIINVKDQDPRDVRKQIRGWMKTEGLVDRPVRIFETSGTAPGQSLAFGLLERGGSLSVVGFTPEKLPLRFSNIMALDADVHGNWGCDPQLYPGVMDPVLDGRVQVRPFIERRRLDDVNEVLAQMRSHQLTKRAVLVP